MRNRNLILSLTTVFTALSLVGCRSPQQAGPRQRPPGSWVSMTYDEHFTNELDRINAYFHRNQAIYYPDPKGRLRELRGAMETSLYYATEFRNLSSPMKTPQKYDECAARLMQASMATYDALRNIRRDYGEETAKMYRPVALTALDASRTVLDHTGAFKSGTKIRTFLDAVDVLQHAIAHNSSEIRTRRRLASTLPEGAQRYGDIVGNLKVLAGAQIKIQQPDVDKVKNADLKKSLKRLMAEVKKFQKGFFPFNALAIESASTQVRLTYSTVYAGDKYDISDQKLTVGVLTYARSIIAPHRNMREAQHAYRTLDIHRRLINVIPDAETVQENNKRKLPQINAVFPPPPSPGPTNNAPPVPQP